MAELIFPKTSSVRKVTITLPGEDVHPPVYIAGSFTKEPWLVQEMDIIQPSGYGLVAMYSKTFHIMPGEYQYKFRLGDGDWWILDQRSATVKDAAGNSNNLLIVPDGKEASLTASDGYTTETQNIQNPTTTNPIASFPPITIHQEGELTTEGSSIVGHEDFLGTWEPDSELSPSHRRVSTSLGVRISRIGTFVPPEPTAEDLKNADLESYSNGRRNVLARMEKPQTELPEDNTSYDNLYYESEDEIERHGTAIPSSFVGSTDKQLEADRIMESRPVPLSMNPALLENQAILHKLPDLQHSYGTVTKEKPFNSIQPHDLLKLGAHAAKPEQAVIPEPTSNDAARERERSDANEPLLRKKSEEQQPRTERKDLMFFAMIASWFRSLWKWLLGAERPAENEDAN